MYSAHLSPSRGDGKHIQDDTIQKEVTQAQRGLLDPSIKVETPIMELPNDENKLFDQEDDVGASTIPDLSLPSEDKSSQTMSGNMLFMSYSQMSLANLSIDHGGLGVIPIAI